MKSTIKTCTIRSDKEKPCVVCGKLTPFIEFCYESYVCSDECIQKLDAEITELCRDKEGEEI